MLLIHYIQISNLLQILQVKCTLVRHGQSKQSHPDLSSNADEADLRVWLHCKNSCGIHKLLYSPDTDVYHIGLTVLSEIPEHEVIVQLSKQTDDRACYLNMKALIAALGMDPDLSQIPPLTRPQLLQSLYVATGSDYTSFFNGIGKVSFLATFFQHASFISGFNGPPGTMGEVAFDKPNTKFSFLHPVGCAYYKHHISAFRTQTPEALFNSINASTTYEQHDIWLAKIRSVVRQRADIESKSMPSTESLLLHWKRCMGPKHVELCHSNYNDSVRYIHRVYIHMHCVCLHHSGYICNIPLAAPTEYGWRREDGQLHVIWEDAKM